MICFTSSLIRQLYHFITDFDHVLLQLLGTGIENSLFKYRMSYRHLTFMIETFDLLMKRCKNSICYSCIFYVQLHVHLKKWTLKFKLPYLRNYISYFNKIYRISCVNIRIQSLKVSLKSILPWLKYSIFSMRLFFIGAPCIFVHFSPSAFLTDLQLSLSFSFSRPSR